MDNIIVKGRVRMVDSTKELGTNGFKKRDVVVTTEEQYPQHILIQFVQDKVNLLDSVKAGDEVRIQVNLRGREWVNPQGETVYFNTIQGWKIDKVAIENISNSTTNPSAPAQPTFEPAPDIDQNAGDNDDLPF